LRLPFAALRHPETKSDFDATTTLDRGHYCLGRLQGFATQSTVAFAGEPMQTTEIDVH